MTPQISPEQRKALDAHNGEPIVVVDANSQQRFVLIAATDERVRDVLNGDATDGPWSKQKEARRRELIDRDISGTISVEERTELAILDRQGNAYYDSTAPRPIEGMRELHEQLLQKRG